MVSCAEMLMLWLDTGTILITSVSASEEIIT